MTERTDYTESGDKYTGTEEAWARYRKAWADNDMDLVMAMEIGEYEGFYYDPDAKIDDEEEEDREWINNDEEFAKLEELGFHSDRIEIIHEANSNISHVNPAFPAEHFLKSGFCPKGTKVRFLDFNGYDHDLKYARDRGMIKDSIYTVKAAYIGDWSSDYTFEEVDGRFNTVMFKEVK